MTPLDEIRAAIEKLERLRDESTPGVWDIIDGGDRFIAWHEDPASTGFEYVSSEPVEFERQADADLIVTLHATIDPMLALLREDHQWLADSAEVFPDLTREEVDQAIPHTMALARAINNGGSNE